MYSNHCNINLDMILLYRITPTAPGGDLPATMDLYTYCGLMGISEISWGYHGCIYIYTYNIVYYYIMYI